MSADRSWLGGERSAAHEQIREALRAHADEHGIQILAASEFGSGCNNLHAPDSDFDLSFVFVRRMPCYFAIDPATTDKGGDTLRINALRVPAIPTVPDDDQTTSSSSSSSCSSTSSCIEIDGQGYDVPLALKMLRDGNLNLLDWLFAPVPIVGNECDRKADQTTRILIEGAKAIIQRAPTASIKALAYQLFSKAKNHDLKFFGGRWTKNVTSKEIACIHKKYFFIVVPLLRLLWLSVDARRDSFSEFRLPPLDVNELMAFADTTAFSCPAPALMELVTRKRQGLLSEEPAPSIPELDAWLVKLFGHLEPFLQELTQAAASTSQQLKGLASHWDRLWFDIALSSAGLAHPSE